jgi:kumamolisin
MARFAPTRVLAGTDRTLAAGTRVVGRPAADAPVRLVIKLRSPESPESFATALGLMPPLERRRISDEEYAERYGAGEDDVAAVLAYCTEHRIERVYAKPAARIVVVQGTVEDVETAFGVDLKLVRGRRGEIYRTYAGPLSVPDPLHDVITTVVGFDDVELGIRGGRRCPVGRDPLSVPDIARLYDFPSGLDGRGQRIALLEFGGGFSAPDFATYFQSLGTAPPDVTVVTVGNGSNDVQGTLSTEVMLDVEVAGAAAPGAELTVYFGMNTMPGWLETFTTAVHDSPAPSVISTSWVKNEVENTKLTLPSSVVNEISRILAEAAVRGITVTAATGDTGFTAGVHDGAPHVALVASIPYALACGGTTLHLASGAIDKETVWNTAMSCATGGGVSEYFPKPPWQATANVPVVPVTKFAGRGIPDVAAAAGLVPGYQIFALGQSLASGGTSASAPLWAALIARVNQRLGEIRPGSTVGYVTPLLYTGVGLTSAFRDVKEDGNGFYSAADGWDPCTGWGTPNGTELLRALTSGQ